MANFSSNVAQLKTAGVGELKAPALDVPDFEFRGKAREGDFMSQLDKMTEAMRKKQAEQRSDFKFEELDLGSVQKILARKWTELLAKYEAEKKKDPDFAVPPNEDQLPKPAPIPRSSST